MLNILLQVLGFLFLKVFMYLKSKLLSLLKFIIFLGGGKLILKNKESFEF